jgi:hypothetical protein
MLVRIIVTTTNHSFDHNGIGYCDFYFGWFLLANARLFAYTILMIKCITSIFSKCFFSSECF